MAEKQPDWKLAKIVLPAVRSSKEFEEPYASQLLGYLYDLNLMPSIVKKDDLKDVDRLIQKLEAIASEDG